MKKRMRWGKRVLFLRYVAEQIVARRYLIATWLRLAISQTQGDHRIWFAIASGL